MYNAIFNLIDVAQNSQKTAPQSNGNIREPTGFVTACHNASIFMTNTWENIIVCTSTKQNHLSRIPQQNTETISVTKQSHYTWDTPRLTNTLSRLDHGTCTYAAKSLLYLLRIFSQSLGKRRKWAWPCRLPRTTKHTVNSTEDNKLPHYGGNLLNEHLEQGFI